MDEDISINRQRLPKHSFPQKHILPLLYLTLFVLVFGETIQPAPRTQIYESIICRNKHLTASFEGGDSCKLKIVQDELAFLKGTERFLGIVPTILAVPSGFAADKYGRNFVLTLSLIGLVLEEAWVFSICWFSAYLPIRLILLGTVFEIVGGGFGVVTTMAHVMVADITSIEARTSIFLTMHATGIAAAILGQLSSSSLMKLKVWLPWFIGIASLMLSVGISCLVVDTSNWKDFNETPLSVEEAPSESDALSPAPIDGLRLTTSQTLRT